MDSIWSILGLKPTRDVSAVRRAYAQKARTCHPEENPEGFLKLRKAYQAALDFVEEAAEGSPDIGETGAGSPDIGEAGAGGPDIGEAGAGSPDIGETGAGGEDIVRSEAGYPDTGEAAGANQEEEGWTLDHRPKYEIESNSYADHEAIQGFLKLYTGKQRKDQKKWLDYFTSDAFLDVAWEPGFTELLLEQILRLEGECPVNREFLIWLCTAYQFTVHRAVYQNPDGSGRTEFQFQVSAGARFDGQESVFEIATKGPVPKKPRGNEWAVSQSFSEYRRLVSMAEEDVWSEREIGEFSEIIGRYAAGYITDKCQQRGDMDYERHPAGLRLITHFFRREGLPEELYRITWRKLELETAVMGRAKLLYGSLREIILDRLPELAGQQRENYGKLREDFLKYAVGTCKLHGENAGADAEDIRKTDIFFAREDFQRALLDRRFVEEEMLHTWVNEDRCDYYLQRVITFYTEHEAAPCAGRVVGRAKEMLKLQKLADRLQKDRETGAGEGVVSLKRNPFFRHWLNTGFYQARDPESGRELSEYLNRELPYLPEWSRAFLETTEGEIFPKAVTCILGRDTLEVCFHLRYMEFMLNREPVYRPCLEWERVAEVEDMDTFFFCLPVTVTAYDHYSTVKEEIRKRLADTAAPEDGREVIAACLAGRVCSLPLPGEAGLGMDWEEEEPLEIRPLPPESLLPFEVFAEDTEHLYGCEWIERSRVLRLFEQLPIGRQMLRGGQCDGVEDAGNAIALARQMLEETLVPPRIPVDLLVNLPDAVYSMPDFSALRGDRDIPFLWSRPVELLGGASVEERNTEMPGPVTRERLEELLAGFASDRLERLELSWNIAAPMGQEQDYDTRRSLVFLKEGSRYACLYFDDFRAKSYALLEKPELYGKVRENLEFVSFRRGRLFRQVIHRSFSSIRRRLDVIFRQVSWPNNVQFMAGGIWDYAVNVSCGRSKYNLDKQLLADFPMERAHNRQDAPFYFFSYPVSAAWVDGQGGMEKLEIGPADGFKLQQLMHRFLKGGFSRLRLSWGREEGRRKHIVLLQEGGRFLMAWLQEEKHTAEYHVADTGTYMDVEGKNYPKDTFQGRVIPAYLIHESVMPLRNALELLLVNLSQPDVITGKMAEYAGEKPVKPRPFETLWEELVGN